MTALPSSSTPRRICVVTGTRADYGLLYWLLHDLKADPRAKLQVIACCMHLSPEFGLTYRIIEKDGFQIDAKVDMLLSSDSPVGVAKSLGLGTIGFADAFDRLRPDVVVILGDRFEALAAAQAAMIARIPIAHIHGGEATHGLIDEAIRHSLTKMAHLHFTAAEPYRQRVIQLGETPERVFVVGAPGNDNLTRLPLLSRADLERDLGIQLRRPLLAVTYHPVTLEKQSPATAMAAMLDALAAIPDATLVMTKGNADTDGRIINQMIDDFVAARPDRALAVTSLGQLRYLSLLTHCDAVIGNSSSGILEAPAAGVPTVNIGKRQAGRIRAASVIDCGESVGEIAAAIQTALSPAMRERAARKETPFGSSGAAAAMRDILLTASLDNILIKSFHDLPAAAR